MTLTLAMVIPLGLALAALAWLLQAAWSAPKEVSPEEILCRCRLELDLVRIELQKLPATRELHEIFDQLAATELAVDLVEMEMCGNPTESRGK